MKAKDVRYVKPSPENYTAEEEIIFNTDFSDPASYEKYLRTVEGEHLVGYDDFPNDDTKGNMTIGVGRNLGPMTNFDKNNPPTITKAQLNQYLKEDLRAARANIEAVEPKLKGYSPALQNIMTDVSFNMGATKFSNKFPGAKRALGAGDLRGLRDNLLYKDPVNKSGVPSKWNTQTGRRAAAIGAALAEMIKKREGSIKEQQDRNLQYEQDMM